MTGETLWKDLEHVRAATPLVHNITNFVVMNTTANALLALGASPVMAHAVEEVEEMAGIAGALVINIGTLSREWVAAMKLAMQTASKRDIPIVLDPVGAGATTYRTQTTLELLDACAPSVIRGNASEISALVDHSVRTKGVDSGAMSDAAVEKAARQLAESYDCVTVVSGATDFLTDGKQELYISNGDALMPRVTGLGCTASALIGAFAAINPDPLEAAGHAMAVLGICGEIAAETAAGPGSLQMRLIDCLYTLDTAQATDRLRCSG